VVKYKKLKKGVLCMAYSDLVALDERTHIETLPFDKVDFKIEETDEGDRLFAQFGDVEVRVRQPRQFETLCTAFDIPVNFAGDMPQELLGEIFATRGKQKADKTFNWAIDTEVEEVIAYGDIRKPYIPFSMVGGILEGVGMEDLDGSLGRNGVGEITGTHPHTAYVEPRVGDITRSGLNVHMNPMNDDPPQVAPWSLRLVCTNGMTSLREKERIKVVGHDVDSVLEQIEFQARKQFEFAERLNYRFADMVSHEVNPTEAMRNLLIAERIPARLHRNLIDEAASLPEDQHTMYDVMNVFTRFATGQFDPIRRFNLQQIGGDATLANHINCSRCGTELQ
jgi:hypothetical protein